MTRLDVDPETWGRLNRLLDDALDRPPGEWERWLAELPPEHRSLRERLARLLSHATDSGESPLLALPTLDEQTDAAGGEGVGPYRLLRRIGDGGMSVVWLAERSDGTMRRSIALKLPRLLDLRPELIERMAGEREILSALNHPNIARLYDAGVTERGQPYLALEHVDGEPIDRYAESRALDIRARLELFLQVARAVAYAHGQLVVHRDLKPANILVTNEGTVRLLDFGIAKLLHPGHAGTSELTRESGRPLTLAYASPEQIRGDTLGVGSDVYSLGVVLYELLSGARPYRPERETPGAMEEAVLSAEPARPSDTAIDPARRRALRGDLDTIVLKALKKRAADRYATVDAFADDVKRYLDGRPVAARPDTLAYRARRFVGRNRLAVAAGALFVVCILGFGGIAAWQARRAGLERDLARVQRDHAEQLVNVLVELFETSNPTVHPGGDSLSVRDFLSRSVPRVLDKLAGQPVARARLRQVFGRIYAAQDRYPEARQALEQTLAEQRRLLGADHPDTLETLHHLGVVLKTIGDPGARAVLSESLERNRRASGEEHPRTARAMAALGHESVALLRQALAIQERLLPPEHPDRVTSQTALANYLQNRGDMEGARALYAAAMEALSTPELRRQPVALTLMSDYATLLRAQNEIQAAETLHRELDRTARVVLGPETRLVAENANNLAVLLAGQGRYAEAETLFRESHAIHVALFGATHADTTNIARSVGTVMGLQERWAEALPWVEGSLAGLDPTTQVRPWHSRRINLARVLHRLGRSREALRILDDAVAALTPRVDDDGPYPLNEALFWQALVLVELGRPTEGERAALTALPLLNTAGEGGILRAGAECVLGWAMLETGRQEQGREIIARALPTYAAWGRADRVMVAKLQALIDPASFHK